MRLNVGLMHRLGGVATLDDDVGVLEAGVDVALLEGHDLRDVGCLGRLRVHTGGEHVGMQHRRAVGHGGFDVDDVRQDFVLHVDQRQRLIGDLGGSSGNGREGMTLIEYLAACHDVIREIAEVHRAFADKGFFRSDFRKILRRHHGLHTREGFRLRCVDRHDARMRVRGAEDLAPQHARGAGIGGENRPPGNLFHPIRTDGAGSDDLQVP